MLETFLGNVLFGLAFGLGWWLVNRLLSRI